MSGTSRPNVIQAARIYLRVSTEQQDLARQEAIVAGARASGFYVAAVYREKASGARPDRPELLRMVADLQPGDALYIPSLWWHHVESIGVLNTMVNYWWTAPAAHGLTKADVLALATENP